MALFFNCCMYKYPADNTDAARKFGMLVDMMFSDGIDFRDRCLWPAVPETLMRPSLEPAESSSYIFASPFVFAAAWTCKPAIIALLILLGDLGDTDFLNECQSDGQTPLIAAATVGQVGTCMLLLKTGADICRTSWDGNSPLFAAASLASSTESKLILSHFIDKLLEMWAHRPAKIWDLLHQPGPGRLTIIQRLLISRQDEFVCRLAPKMDPLLVYTDHNPLRIACERDAGPNKESLLASLLSSTSQSLTDALVEHDSEHGVTVLGLAVAWGDKKTVEILASACSRQGLQLAPLLERHVDRSPHSTPLFTAIIHHHPDTLRSLAAFKTLGLTPGIRSQHLLLSPEALQDGAPRPAGREFVRAPQPGKTESISIFVCAASVGNVCILKTLLKGVDAREEPFPGNRWYKTAMTAAIDFPDLAGFPGGEELPDGATSSMGPNQLACVQVLLKAGGAMTEKQMYRVLDTIYHVSDTEIGAELFSLMKRLAMCRRCKLVGCWRKCSGGCCASFYCSVACQKAGWPQHREQCRPVKPALDSALGVKAVAELAATAAQQQLGM